MEILELVNTLAITFAGTEYFLFGKNNTRAFLEKYKYPSTLALGVNLLAQTLRCQDHPLFSLIERIARFPWRAVQLLGFELLVSLTVTALFTGFLLGYFQTKGVRKERGVLVVYIVCAFAISFVVTSFCKEDVHDKHIPILAKALCATIGYCGVFFADTKRFAPQLGARDLGLLIAQSIFFTLPLFPLVAVVISFFFLVIVGIVENVMRLDPSFLNWPVYYFTLFGPFIFIYLQAKTLCLERVRSTLPLP